MRDRVIARRTLIAALTIGINGISILLTPVHADSAAQTPTDENNNKAVYKTQNPDGSVSFSDTPLNTDSTSIELPEPTTLPIQTPRIRTYRPSSEPERSIKVDVTIRSPAHEQSFRNVSEIPIRVSLNPPYGSARLEITHNGSPLEGQTIKQPHRGEHRIQVTAFSPSGALLGKSEPRIFYVHQPTINRNAAN